MQLPDILKADQTDTAADLVRAYYKDTFKHGRPRSGSRFDDWAGGGDAPAIANRVTADDLIAVSFLSVEIKPQAAIGLLETHAARVSELLDAIPADLDLADADIEVLNAPDSPASELWDLVRGKRHGKWGVGQTTASKILARKRPKLIPIYDSVVGPLMGLKHSGGQWKVWYEALADGNNLSQRLETIRQKSGAPENLSKLRIMDVALWMDGKRRGLKVVDDDPDD